ncbi:MAG: PhzF family phenazine biosynthesis isomerase, partial [Bacteroidota bacterium]
MEEFTYYLVDVFTSTQFGGNPLAVFPNAQGLTTEQMQKIANELNLSETTFILPPQDANHDCQVRIFTPAVELPMAGHPTVGTAFVLLTNQLIKPKNQGFLLFEEGVGAIKVNFNQSIDNELNITMEQPLPRFGAIYPDKSKIAALLS